MSDTAFGEDSERIPVAPPDDARIFGCLSCYRCPDMLEWMNDQVHSQPPSARLTAFDTHFQTWLLRQRRPRLALASWLIATGSAEAAGLSMEKVAKKFGTTRQNVSKYARKICAEFKLPVSAYMRSEAACRTYRRRNWRPERKKPHAKSH